MMAGAEHNSYILFNTELLLCLIIFIHALCEVSTMVENGMICGRGVKINHMQKYVMAVSVFRQQGVMGNRTKGWHATQTNIHTGTGGLPLTES